jgi:hypothetical protein
MAWTETADGHDAHREWARDDACATIRLRRRGEGWVVRLDRLTQAPEGSLYRDERVDTEAEAERLVERWLEAYDVAESE